MGSALDEIAFLANSENRVAVFQAVVEAPRRRHELRDAVDASRVTIARILRELEDRGWIEYADQTYAVTPLGEWVCSEFSRLVEEVRAEQRLREPLQWLPADAVPVDVRCFRDAEILLLNECDATALVRRIVEFHRSGDLVRGVARGGAPVFVENQWDLTINGDTRVEMVVTPAALDVIRDHPPSARRLCEMLNVENAQYFVYDEIPISVGIVDDAVGINLIDEQGAPQGGLVTENETVHEWAVDLFEHCREHAKPIEPDAISA